MSDSTRQKQARAFAALHVPGDPLLLANAWDAASARIVEDAGAPAVATTSGGVAWSHGVADGDFLGREAAVDAVRRICAAVSTPVTADVESGYADSPDGVSRAVAEVVAAGAVGINIEDGQPDPQQPLRDSAAQAERITAARAAAQTAGVPLFVNARIDTYLRVHGDPDTRLSRTLERAEAYMQAGASGIFVPGVADADTVGALVAGIDAPVNILAGPGSPTVKQLAALGAARVSLGSTIAVSAYALVRRASRALYVSGSYAEPVDGLTHAELNGLFGD